MPVGHPGVQRAVRFVVAAGARAVRRARFQIGEGVDDPGRIDVVEPEGAHPGVSMTQPCAPLSGSASAEVVVCLPRPVTALTWPVARWRSTSALTRVVFPTPLWPTKAVIRPLSCSRTAAVASASKFSWLVTT